MVRHVFDKFLADLVTVPQLVKYANEIGLRIHRRRKIGGKPLTNSVIHSMLTNVFYSGKYVYGPKCHKIEYQCNHSPMITEEEFDRIQDLLGGKHNSRPQNELYDYLFRGMMKYGKCGFAIVTEKHKKTYKNGRTQKFTYCRCSGKCRVFYCLQQSKKDPEGSDLIQWCWR